MSKSDSDEPAMTPKQMLEKTVRLYENLVGMSTRLSSKKPEVSLIILKNLLKCDDHYAKQHFSMIMPLSYHK